MTKSEIEIIFNQISGNYSWELYLFGIDNRKSGSPYKITKINFKNSENILELGEHLVECIKKFQLSKVQDIEVYCGENPKITCDSLELNNEVIKEYWNYFNTSLENSVIDSCENIKIKGYLIYAKPKKDNFKKILFVKNANPIVQGNKKNSKTFKMEDDDTLDSFNDKIYKFYLTADFFVIENILYTFNLSFQEVFKIEKTLKAIKEKEIKKIFEKEYINSEDKEHFHSISSQMYSNLNIERLESLNNTETRMKVAQSLGLQLDSTKSFVFNNVDEIKEFIKYLNNRIIQEEGTRNIFEISGSVKVRSSLI